MTVLMAELEVVNSFFSSVVAMRRRVIKYNGLVLEIALAASADKFLLVQELFYQ